MATASVVVGSAQTRTTRATASGASSGVSRGATCEAITTDGHKPATLVLKCTLTKPATRLLDALVLSLMGPLAIGLYALIVATVCFTTPTGRCCARARLLTDPGKRSGWCSK